ncbi:hypothetical protein ACB094_05G056100 [Castanea mollissima]
MIYGTTTLLTGSSAELGLFFLIIGGWCSYKILKERRNIKRKKFFKRNGGLLLQQYLSSSEVNVEKIKLFDTKDLDKAIYHFNVKRILGQGGQGTVHKGMLPDVKIVAVKKSKVIDEGKLEQFINKVIILSQINHRNVIKLIGCCLETKFPLLVYEFIPNGTLSQYLRDQNDEFPPTAKVANFGTSRYVAIDQTHLTAAVSDVCSFGVVLAELLTGEKAISSITTQEFRSLATYFIHSMDINSFLDILDAQIMNEDKREQMIAMAKLAKRCLNLKGKKRPTMKEVAMELEAIQMFKKVQQNYEEVDCARNDMYEPLGVVSASTIC